MLEEGMLQRHPAESIYGMHNWPELPVGQFAIRPGPMMAAFDIFEIAIKGRGGHAAMPHLAVDLIAAAAQMAPAAFAEHKWSCVTNGAIHRCSMLQRKPRSRPQQRRLSSGEQRQARHAAEHGGGRFRLFP